MMSDSNSFKDNRSTDYNEVLLCDINGNYKGTKDKLQAHLDGDLHIAFSVQLVRPSRGKQKGIELLLQRRAEGKYHSEGLWTNTCCSHPLINESLEVACKRRVQEELNIELTSPIKKITEFTYRAELDNGLVEHEYDHLFIVYQDVSECVANPFEVSETQWLHLDDIAQAISNNPEHFSAWFPAVFEHVKTYDLSTR